MNSWNFNEVTQQDILDFKACKHNKTGEIYGIPDKSMCQSGKEVSKEEIAALAKKANAGDKKARAQIDSINKAKEEGKAKGKAEEAAAKKKAEDKLKADCQSGAKKGKECKGIKKEKGGKGGKGKGKGGGKGKGKGGAGKGKGKGGSGSAKTSGSQMSANAARAQRQAAANRQKRAKEIRQRISELQKTIRSIKNPELRKLLEQQIADALKSVSELTGKKPGESQDPAKPGQPAAPKPPGKGTGTDTSTRTNEKGVKSL